MAGLVYDPSLDANWRAIQSGDLPSGSVSPLTTKGDVWGYSTRDARIPVGADGNVLTADSTQALGVKWAPGGGTGTVSLIDSPGGSVGVTNGAGPTTDLDLPASGAAAGTYGSSTQVAQVAVNARGIVTGVSNVSISGLAGTGLVKLFESTLGVAAATIDTGAGGIVAGHGDLIILIITQNNVAAATATTLMRVNNDSGANYDNQNVSGSNGAAGAGISLAATSWSFVTHGTAGTAGYPGSAVVMIPRYDKTAFNKVGSAQIALLDATAANNQSILRAIGWRNTAAISRISIVDSTAANLLAGSSMVVYGTQ